MITKVEIKQDDNCTLSYTINIVDVVGDELMGDYTRKEMQHRVTSLNEAIEVLRNHDSR